VVAKILAKLLRDTLKRTHVFFVYWFFLPEIMLPILLIGYGAVGSASSASLIELPLYAAGALYSIFTFVEMLNARKPVLVSQMTTAALRGVTDAQVTSGSVLLLNLPASHDPLPSTTKAMEAMRAWESRQDWYQSPYLRWGLQSCIVVLFLLWWGILTGKP